MALCEYCNIKRISISPYTCKCGLTLLCTVCRYPESHKCQFDFKLYGKEQISKNNPIISKPKIDKF